MTGNSVNANDARREPGPKSVTTQIRCPYCGKRANDVIYPATAPTFVVQTVCWNRQCRRHYVVRLPIVDEKQIAS